MRILKLEEFLKEPKGTVYMKFQPMNFEEIMIKGETNDLNGKGCLTFLTETLAPSIEADDYFENEGSDKEIESESFCYTDANYNYLTNENQLFAVLNREEVMGMYNDLKKVLKGEKK